MRGAVLHAPGDVRVEERADPTIVEPTDAVIRLSATCVCGSDLWPYRGIEKVDGPDADGARVRRHRRGGRQRRHARSSRASSSSARSSPPTTPARSAGPATRPRACTGEPRRATGAQAERLRVPLADGTLVATPDVPSDDLVPSLLAASDVLGTGWFGAVAAEVGPGKTVAVVGDGAVGLLGVLAARAAGRRADHRDEPPRAAAEARPASSARPTSSPSAATRASRRSRSSPTGSGAHSVIEAVGTQESMMQAIRVHPPRRARRLRRRRPRRRAARRGAVLLPRPPARRPGPGAPVPARADRPDLEPHDRPRQGLRPRRCRSTRPPRATGPWTSAARSRPCCSPEPFFTCTNGDRRPLVSSDAPPSDVTRPSPRHLL